MKFIVSILLTALLGFASPLFLPWWAFAITSFIVGFIIPQKAWMSFAAGFIALFALWGIMALIIDNANEHILSRKIALLLPLNGSIAMLIFITAITGGIISGFAALTGRLAKKKNLR